MAEPDRKIPYYRKARRRFSNKELCEELNRYYFAHDAPLGEYGACIWLVFRQWTQRN